MSVYVDDMRAKFRGMVMCHMIADTHEELLAMAEKLGLAKRWIQCRGTYREHFDISLSKRMHAVAYGAKEVTQLELGRIVHSRRPTDLGVAYAG